MLFTSGFSAYEQSSDSFIFDDRVSVLPDIEEEVEDACSDWDWDNLAAANATCAVECKRPDGAWVGSTPAEAVASSCDIATSTVAAAAAACLVHDGETACTAAANCVYTPGTDEVVGISQDAADGLCDNGIARECGGAYFCSSIGLTTTFESKYETTVVEGETKWCDAAVATLRAPLFSGDSIPECKVRPQGTAGGFLVPEAVPFFSKPDALPCDSPRRSCSGGSCRHARPARKP